MQINASALADNLANREGHLKFVLKHQARRQMRIRKPGVLFYLSWPWWHITSTEVSDHLARTFRSICSSAKLNLSLFSAEIEYWKLLLWISPHRAAQATDWNPAPTWQSAEALGFSAPPRILQPLRLHAVYATSRIGCICSCSLPPGSSPDTDVWSDDGYLPARHILRWLSSCQNQT